MRLSSPARQALLNWYDANHRDLPWRQTSDPYAVWVSEVMLQQTQVATAEAYWRRWMERFPTVQCLADADDEQVLSMWQGLGYYRRCRLLLDGARAMNNGVMPGSAAEWQKLSGVGRYTAGAIASIALGEPAPVVDGNVERVFSRLTNDPAPKSQLNRRAWEWAEENIDRSRPGIWNQALMELGATMCLPKNPACDRCPLAPACQALSAGTVEGLPTPRPQPKPVTLRHTTWIPLCDGQFGVRQIPSGQWWHGMWEFPRTCSDDVQDLACLVGPAEVRFVGEIRHSVTHHRITLEVYVVSPKTRSACLKWHSSEGLARIPMPSPQRKAFKLVAAS